MEESRKKVVMILIAVACIGIAAAVTFVTYSGGSVSYSRGKTVWMKCVNPDCGHEFSMDEADYLEFVRDNAVPGFPTPAMQCPQCEQRSAIFAEKCEKCGNVFLRQQESDYDDRCPKCGYSKKEARKLGTQQN